MYLRFCYFYYESNCKINGYEYKNFNCNNKLNLNVGFSLCKKATTLHYSKRIMLFRQNNYNTLSYRTYCSKDKKKITGCVFC